MDYSKLTRGERLTRAEAEALQAGDCVMTIEDTVFRLDRDGLDRDGEFEVIRVAGKRLNVGFLYWDAAFSVVDQVGKESQLSPELIEAGRLFDDFSQAMNKALGREKQ